MIHEGAPPETPDQITCREWWAKAQPHVKRAWGRDENGGFLAEDTRLLYKFFLFAKQLGVIDS